MSDRGAPLRIALLAGTLGRGGAEKQLVYMASALREAGACVRVFTLGENEFYEAALRDAGVPVIQIGRAANPGLRLWTFVRALYHFRPHIVQAAHFYVNLYVAFASWFCGSLGIGAIRNDGRLEFVDNGWWAPFLLRIPAALVANSDAARRNAGTLGVDQLKVQLVSNVIDVEPFHHARGLRGRAGDDGQPLVTLVGRLERRKRVDRFLEILALARRSAPELRGVVVGVGRERETLELHAGRLGLLPEGVRFHGASDNVPRILAEADMLALTSDHEGSPNVILEAMAAGLPVVTTPAGDAGVIVQDGITGYVVPFDGVEAAAERIVHLARSPDLRRTMGEAACEHVKRSYSCEGLSDRLFSVYRTVARQCGHDRVLARLPLGTTVPTP